MASDSAGGAAAAPGSNPPSAPSDLFIPAPYGRACSACARAKCKCFFRSEGVQCERCLRLGKTCEPTAASGKRKARSQQAASRAGRPPPHEDSQPEPRSPRLEERLEDLVTLLRSQAVEKEHQQQQPETQRSTFALAQFHNSQSSGSRGGDSRSTPSSSSHFSGSSQHSKGSPVPPLPPMDGGEERNAPSMSIDMKANHLQIFKGGKTMVRPLLLEDIAPHESSDRVADEQLRWFRTFFLPMSPVVHIPENVTAAELRSTKPFLWLVIMCLTTRTISLQFAMEETIWRIINRRIVLQHLNDLDLLQGMICFAAWSHYFKQNKPFMTMLTQMVVHLVTDLSLNVGETLLPPPRKITVGYVPFAAPTQVQASASTRTLEERRTMLAVFHLTSAAWTTYRKVEPLRWTPYLDECLRTLLERKETRLDYILANHVKCQLIINQVTVPVGDGRGGEAEDQAPSPVLVAAMLGSLNDIRHSMPPDVQAMAPTQFYQLNTEITVRESLLRRPKPQEAALQGRPGGGSSVSLFQIKRLAELEALLVALERWVGNFATMTEEEWCGVTVDHFGQFTHCMVVLFRLVTVEEPGWDPEEARRRADPLEVIEGAVEIMERIPSVLGMIDAQGPRRGLAFKTTYLLRAIKALFLAELAPTPTPPVQQLLQQVNEKQLQQHQAQQQQMQQTQTTSMAGYADGLPQLPQQTPTNLQSPPESDRSTELEQLPDASAPAAYGVCPPAGNFMEGAPLAPRQQQQHQQPQEQQQPFVPSAMGFDAPMPNEFMIDFNMEPWWLAEILDTQWLPQ